MEPSMCGSSAKRFRFAGAIHNINGFSAHAAQWELLAWKTGVAGCERTSLVHGEEPAMKELAAHLRGCRREMPQLKQAFEL